MTICVAAVCQMNGSPMIVGASDRKYTVGDYTYEPFQTKHHPFTQSIVALISGTISADVTMCQATSRRLVAAPTSDTQAIAEYHAESFAEYRRREAERALLWPLGIDFHQLMTDPQIPDSTAIRLSDELRRWELEDEAIIAGIDADQTAHLYRVLDPGWANCEDGPGFTAIGSGAGHAMAEFMHYGYYSNWSAGRALLLTYSAKKRAEVDAFVGKETDVIVIGPGRLSYAHVASELREELEAVYNKGVVEDAKLARSRIVEFEGVVDEFLRKQTQTEQQTGTEGEAEAGAD